MKRRVITHQVFGNKPGDYEMFSVLTVERLVEMGIVRQDGSTEFEDGDVTIEVRFYRKA